MNVSECESIMAFNRRDREDIIGPLYHYRHYFYLCYTATMATTAIRVISECESLNV